MPKVFLAMFVQFVRASRRITMRFRIGVLVASAGFALFAANPPENQLPAIRPIPVSAGQEMFMSYCAACHGRDGKGTGPVAPALNTRATDLTTLAQRNNGAFPASRVKASIHGDLRAVAHGSREMPVWGSLFRYLGSGSPGEVEVRIASLTSYIESLQEPPKE